MFKQPCPTLSRHIHQPYVLGTFAAAVSALMFLNLRTASLFRLPTLPGWLIFFASLCVGWKRERGANANGQCTGMAVSDARGCGCNA